jgi:hypothetical protein
MLNYVSNSFLLCGSMQIFFVFKKLAVLLLTIIDLYRLIIIFQIVELVYMATSIIFKV